MKSFKITITTDQGHEITREYQYEELHIKVWDEIVPVMVENVKELEGNSKNLPF